MKTLTKEEIALDSTKDIDKRYIAVDEIIRGITVKDERKQNKI